MSMGNRPGISIVICTWNRAVSLRATLLSLDAQKGCADYPVEVVVVDNNSSDDTRKVVDEMMPAWRFGTLRYTFEPRQGKQFALNRGIGFCTHDILAFSDDDIIFAPDWTRAILNVFEDPSIDLVGGKTHVIWPASGQPAWYHLSMSAVLGAVDLGDEKLAPAPQEYAPAGANLIARRSLFQRIGGFSETHFRHMDFEFGMRSSRMKAAVSYQPSLLVYAPVDSACLTKRYFRRWAFKAGIARDSDRPASEATFLAVPRWVYRQLLEDLWHLVFRAAGSAAAENFSHELRFWRCLGKVASCWHEKLRPSRHAQWVEGYSQKKKNLY